MVLTVDIGNLVAAKDKGIAQPIGAELMVADPTWREPKDSIGHFLWSDLGGIIGRPQRVQPRQMDLPAPGRQRTGMLLGGIVGLVGVITMTPQTTMESLQMFLPVRVPSNVDAALNVMGAWLGAVIARGLVWVGLIERWSRFRDRWFVNEATGAQAVFAVWPLGLLFTAPLPLGLGHVF